MFLSSLVALLAVAGGASAQEPRFEFRNGFWRNLHHLLFAQALLHPDAGKVRTVRLVASDQVHADALDEREAAIWARAVDFYASHLVQRDLLFDEDMVALGRALSDADPDAPLESTADIPADVRDVLESAATIYRLHWWNGHRDHNERWRLALAPLLQRHGAALRAHLERLFESPWPGEPVVVDLVYYANAVGAYTSLDPVRITIGTSDAHIQRTSALEILMHETAHAMVGRLRDHIARADGGGGPGSPLPRDLWHQVQFHLVGEAVAAQVDGHVPYADAIDLWSRAWSVRQRNLIEVEMKPLLAGHVSLRDAADALIRRLDSPSAGAERDDAAE